MKSPAINHFIEICCLLSAIYFSSNAFAEVTLQGSPQDAAAYLLKNERQVTLEGDAETTVDASKITVYVNVFTEGNVASVAATKLEQQKKEFLDKLEASGISRGQVKIPKFAIINPRYSKSDSPDGFNANSILTIEINDQKSYLNLIELADKSGSVKITETNYDHEQITNLRKANLANACKRIMIRKDVYEQNLGVTLLPVSVLENPGSNQPKGFDQSPNGQITIKNSIQITFAIVPASSSSLAKATASKTDSEPTPSPTPASQ